MHRSWRANRHPPVIRVQIPHRVLLYGPRWIVTEAAHRETALVEKVGPVCDEIHAHPVSGGKLRCGRGGLRLDARTQLAREIEVRTELLTPSHRRAHSRSSGVRIRVRMNHERARFSFQFGEKCALAHNLPLYQLSAIWGLQVICANGSQVGE